MKHTQATPCPGCNGTGQMTYFGGVSRFQFSYVDCPECNGIGFLESAQDTILSADQVAANSPLSPRQAEQFLKILAQTLSATLIEGEAINLRGFGNFSHTSFMPGKALLESINNSTA